MHRRTASKTFITDGSILGEIDQVRHTLKLARQTEQYNPQVGENSVGGLERRLADLAEKAAESAVTFVVQAIPGEEFDDMVRRYPPTPQQFEQYQVRLKAAPFLATILAPPEMDDEKMAPELLAASLVEPDWSKDEVAEFWRGLSKGEQNELWNLAHGVQIAEPGADLPFFNAATGMTSGGGDQLTLPANGASPSQSF